MNILILASFLSFSLANDYFGLQFIWEAENEKLFMGFFITNGGIFGAGILAPGTLSYMYEQTFTCPTCDSGVAQSQVTLMSTDGSDTIIMALDNIFNEYFMNPYWGSGVPLTMSWDYDGSNVTFYVEGIEYTPYCRESEVVGSGLQLFGGTTEYQGYVKCSSLGNFTIVY